MKLTLILLGVMLASASYADVGTRGGGQIVDVDGHPVLRDLVDKTTCLWVTAENFGKTLPHFSVIQNNLGRTDWYLEYLYEQELKALAVCQSEDHLVSIPADDEGLVTIDRGMVGKQVAVRLNNQIYIDMNYFRKMSPTDRSYLLLHEVTHSFIPMDVDQRNTKLRSFVNAVESLEKTPMNASDLALQLKEDAFSTPTVPIAASLRQDFFTSVDSSQPLNARFVAVEHLRSGGVFAISSDGSDCWRSTFDYILSSGSLVDSDLALEKQVLIQASSDLNQAIGSGDADVMEAYAKIMNTSHSVLDTCGGGDIRLESIKNNHPDRIEQVAIREDYSEAFRIHGANGNFVEYLFDRGHANEQQVSTLMAYALVGDESKNVAIVKALLDLNVNLKTDEVLFVRTRDNKGRNIAREACNQIAQSGEDSQGCRFNAAEMAEFLGYSSIAKVLRGR